MDRKLAAAILSALLYAQGLLGFAALAGALLHGHWEGAFASQRMAGSTDVPPDVAGRIQMKG